MAKTANCCTVGHTAANVSGIIAARRRGLGTGRPHMSVSEASAVVSLRDHRIAPFGCCSIRGDQGKRFHMDRRLFLRSAVGTGALLLPVGPVLAQAGPGAYAAAHAAWLDRAAREAPWLPELEEAVLTATNDRRDAAGLPPLETDPALRRIARFYADQLAGGARFDHVDAEGRTPGDRIAILHRRLVGTSGENLFQSNVWRRSEQRAAGRYAVDSLMRSPGHRANILSADWTVAGMGAAAAGDTFHRVQLFARPFAMLTEDLPLTHAAGAPLPPSASRFAEGSAERIAFAPPDRQPDGGDLQPLARARVPRRTGPHGSFYAIPESREGGATRYAVAPGPMIVIE